MAFLFFTNKNQPVYIDFQKRESTDINYSRHHFSLLVSAIVSVFILATLQFMLHITLQEKQNIENSENQQNNGPCQNYIKPNKSHSVATSWMNLEEDILIRIVWLNE